ncbi:MAG: methyltransferase family protein [Candidatus Hodarchaeales archaeon]
MSEELSIIRLMARVIFAFIFYGILFFIPAGDLGWIEGWTFLIVSFVNIVVVVFIFRNDPAILQSRSKIRPEKGWDALFIVVAAIFFLALIIIAGLDYRYSWTAVPGLLVLTSFAIIIVSFAIITAVMKENSFASKTVTVQEGQKVITTGPYAIVRHPMYAGFILMILFLPLALGSYLAFFPGVVVALLIVIRIPSEEKTLLDELEGYEEYTQKVRYRLIPKIW